MLRRKSEEEGEGQWGDEGNRGSMREEVGVLTSDALKYGREAVELRIECTNRMRREILKLRGKMGWPDEDPKNGLAETWKLEGKKREGLGEDAVV